MKKLFLAVVMTTAFGLSLLSQVPSVSIKIDTAERFRFEGNRLNFLNPGRNVLIGDSTGFKMDPSASGNVYIGDLTGQWDTMGFYNTFIGSQAGYSNRTGIRNTFLGFGAGQGNSSGARNTFVGMWAGATNFDGSHNTYIGRNTAFYNQNGYGNVFIGDNAGVFELGSNMLYIANTNTTTPLIYGEFDNAFLRFNAYNTESTGDFMSYGKVRANDVFSHNGTPGISDTANYVTNIDFQNGMLKYRTVVYSGGIATYNSDESGWVTQVGDPIFLCGQISLIGEFSGWSLDHLMTRDINNPDLWTTTMYLTAENDFMPQDGLVEMKFRENQDWSVNWGSDLFPSGTAIPLGPNIPVPLNINFTTTIYEIAFNCKTGEFTFTDVSQ